jgi:hypothetical protein
MPEVQSGKKVRVTRNIDFQSVRLAEMFSAVSSPAGYKPAGRTGHSPMFQLVAT